MYKSGDKQGHGNPHIKMPPIYGDIAKLCYGLLKTWLPKEISAFSKYIGPILAKKEFRINQELVWYLKPLVQFLYYQYFRVDVDGIKNIPLNGPAIIVANHAGCLPYDGVMVNLAVFNEHPRSRTVRFLVHDFAFALPFIGNFVELSGGVRASHENAIELIRQKQLILVFPEGVKGIGKQYNERYKLKRFGRGGFIRLAIRAGVPVIPAAIIGSEEIHPIIWTSEEMAKPLGIPFFPFTPTFPWLGPFGLIPLPAKWKIIFGKPISFKRYRTKDTENPRLMQKLSQEMRSKVQQMINAALAKRKSIWF